MPDRSDGNGSPGTTGGSNTEDSDSGPSAGDWAFEAQTHYDPSDSRELTTAIISAIAEAEGASITEIKSPPLHEVIDAIDVENALFGRGLVSREDTKSSAEFEYRGHRVSIESDGWIFVCRRTDAGHGGGDD